MDRLTSWNQASLADLGDFANGLNFGKDSGGVAVPLINVKDIFSDIPRIDVDTLDQVCVGEPRNLERMRARANDLFFVRSSVKRDGVGLVSMSTIDSDAVHCGFVIRFRITSKLVHPEFLCRALRSPNCREAIRNLSGGAAITNISQQNLGRLTVSLPSIAHQRRIAEVLSAYDDLIENNTKRIKILEGMAHSLYCEWFREFRFPGYPNARFVETDIGRVPKGWQLGALGDVVTLQRGFDLPGRDRCPGRVPIVSSSGVTGTHDTAKVDAPGIVTGRYGTLGEVYFIHEPFWPLNTTLFVKDFKGSNPYWLLYLLRSLNFSRQNAAGAVPGVNRNALHMLRIVIPQPNLQQQFGTQIGPILEQAEILKHKSTVLSLERDLILPRLISGEIELPA